MPEIDAGQLAAALQSRATVVDVREPREYADGHVPGAVNIPMGRLPGRIDEIDRQPRCTSSARPGTGRRR